MDSPGHFVCQSAILRLPVLPRQFDIVADIGFIQHSPVPEKTIAALCSNLRPGGWLPMNHHSHTYLIGKSRKKLRDYLLNLKPEIRSAFRSDNGGSAMASSCRPFQDQAHPRHGKIAEHAAGPLYPDDYHNAYPQLGSKLLQQWAFLDTFDTLTDRYKHLRSKEEIEITLRACGMADIRAWHGGNGIESCSRKPLPR